LLLLVKWAVFPPDSFPQWADYQQHIQLLDTTELKAHIYWLADDALEGREAGKRGQRKSAHYLRDYYRKLGMQPLFANQSYFQPFILANGDTTENVAAFLPGNGKLAKENIIITAHYDHIGIKNGVIYNGADDNASGTAALMELAQAFQRAYQTDSQTPRRSIIFFHTTAEEKGLIGSAHYVKVPPLPLNQTIANLNMDMIGRFDQRHANQPDYVYLIGANRLSKEFDLIIRAANDTCCKLALDYTLNSPNHPEKLYYRSDHYTFIRKGIPAVFIFTGLPDDYHKPTDDAAKIDYSLTLKITQLVFTTAWHLVHKPQRLSLDY
jgi:Zn-dependent M28 family amino/carboxypeptidase